MSQLIELRAAVVAGLTAVLPRTFKVEGHLGRFTADDLNQFLTIAPAVKVAILGLKDGASAGDDGGDLDCRVQLAAYVVTKDETAAARDVVALAAVETIACVALGNRWGLPFAFAALPAGAQNLTNSDALKRGRALWAVEIGQPIRLWSPEDGDAGATLRQMYVGVAPEIGLAHVDDYVGPIPATEAAEAGDD